MITKLKQLQTNFFNNKAMFKIILSIKIIYLKKYLQFFKTVKWHKNLLLNKYNLKNYYFYKLFSMKI